MKKVGLIIAFLCLIVLFYLGFLRYIRVDEIKMSGYAVSSTQIKQNLQSNEIEENYKNLALLPINEYEVVYQRGNEYYIGEKKKENINLNYPIISEDGTRILNQSSEVKGITSEYERENLYKNAVIANGEIYHVDDGLKSEEETYIFLEIEPSIYMNLRDMTIKTVTQEYFIKKNSYIYFAENFVHYYNYEEKNYQYFSYDDLDAESEVTLLNEKITYEDFLIKLGIKEAVESIDEIPNLPQAEETPVIPEEPTEQPAFVNPTVQVSNFQVNTYSIFFGLDIRDEAKKIKKAPTFELYINNRLYKRNSFSISGNQEISKLLPNTTYKIIGYFTYYNEFEELVRTTFYENEFTTQGIVGLESINLNYDQVESGSNYVNIKGLQITNDSNSEVLKGIDHFNIEIQSEEYSFSNSISNSMIKLEKVDYTTPYVLKSNTEYTLKIKAYDVGENELQLNNNVIQVKTSKQIPLVNVEITNTNITEFTALLEIEDPDKVGIQNLTYTIVDTNNKVITEGMATEEFTVSNLNENSIYTLYIYGDYDLEDGKGNHIQEKLKEIKVSTVPVVSLGYLQVNITNEEIYQESAVFDFSLNTLSTDAKYIALLDKIIISIIDKESGKEVSKIEYLGEQIENLRNGGIEKLSMENLTSKTEYDIQIESSIRQGDKEYTTESLSNVTEFKTKKKEANIHIINKFTTSNLIDFDVKVNDEDEAINSKRVILEVRNSDGSLLSYQEIGINEEYKRITLDDLEVNQKYTFTYIAEDYNIGYDNSTVEENKILYEDEIVTEEGISGKINLQSLLKQLNGKNKFDIEDEQRWTTTQGDSTSELQEFNYDDNSISFTSSNGKRTYAYYLPELIGKEITISFKAKNENSSSNLSPYIVNGNSLNKNFEIKDITNEYKEYSYTFKLNNQGYIGIYLEEVSGGTTKISLKDIQIEEGNHKTDYESFVKGKKLSKIKAAIEDKRNEIINQKYYIQKYRNNEFVEEKEYSLEEGYTKEFQEEVDDNATYKFILQVKIRERYYTLDELEFDTVDEIRSINTIDEFFAMHSNGNYVVTNDLDFRNSTKSYNTFLGNIDFQGHKVLVKNNFSNWKLFANSYGLIENVDVYYYKNDKYSNISGLVTKNYGTIRNIKVNVMETIADNTYVKFISESNYGTIENFAVWNNVVLSGKFRFSLVTFHNFGTIQNGYTYGEDIIINSSDGSNSVLVSLNERMGIIQNVYVLNKLSGVNNNIEFDATGNLTGINNGMLQNSYSTGGGENRELSLDINTGQNNGNIKNLYYISSDLYAGDTSVKVSPMALWNIDFQNNTLNQDQMFLVDEYVSKGYYPQLVWPEYMPTQELLALPKVKDEDLVDFLSVESVNQHEKKATAVLLLSNPSHETIKDIKIQYVDTSIIEQVSNNGTTRLTIEITNPILYTENYGIESITVEGVANITYTRDYSSGERVASLNLYRPIYTINDWKDIKNSASESYMLMNDLDFLNQSSETIRLGDFRGKLNGNNYTIKNIEIVNGKPMISNLYGTIENLFIENYKFSTTDTHAGIVYQSRSNSVINNVHVLNSILGARIYIGGLVGYGNGGSITNSSVTNLTIYQNVQNTDNLHIGGIAGVVNNGTVIQNSFAQDLDIEIPDVYSIYTVGGIAGSITSGSIQNAYSIGKINAASSNIGGIVGFNNGAISNVFSNVDIYTKGMYIGGIVGNISENSSYVSLNNALSLGDIYTASYTVNIGRIIGNLNAVYNNAYAWNSQHLNGEITSINSNILLSAEELKDSFTYTNRILLGEYFDYDNVSIGELPKLYDTNKTQLLPNQKDLVIEERLFEKKDLVIDNRITEGTILLTLKNPHNYKITDVEIENIKITSVTRNTTVNGETTIQLEVEPEYAIDSYRLTKIKYLVDDKEYISLEDIKIPLQFYKDLKTYEDWQQISTEVAENYRLTGDIDFQNYENINHNVLFNRLEGIGDGYTLKNITLNLDESFQGLIGLINNSMKNISFENINITQTKSGTTYYVGVIVNSKGNIENVNFKNITINAPNTNFVGIIANFVSADSNYISLEQITVQGKAYVGGFIGRSNSSDSYNSTVSDVYVLGKENYVGGFVGYVSSSGYFIDGIESTNMEVTSNGNYVGGIIGRGTLQNAKISHSKVSGKSYIGGAGGYFLENQISNNIVVDHVDILGNGSRIGGIVGLNSYYLDNCVVINSEVKTESYSNYVGGIAGSTGWSIRYCLIADSEISVNGQYVGGTVGLLSWGSVTDIDVNNVIVEGSQYVGGIAGGHTSMSNSIQNSSVQATIIAKLKGAGGVIGYNSNSSSTNNTNYLKIDRVLVLNSTISAPNYAGGVIGLSELKLLENHFKNLIIIANIETTGEGNSPGIVIGNGDDYAENVTNLGIYNESKLINSNNESIVGDLNIEGITTSSYLNASQLALQNTYTSRSFSTSNWNFSELKNGYYPFLKKVNQEYITLIPLPVSTQNIMSTMSLMSMGYINNLHEYHELPEYEVYVSGANTINIEFSRIDPSTMFVLNDQSFFIDQRVYSFAYYFDEELKITLTDGWNSKEKNYSSEDLKQTLLTFKEYYYFLQDGKVVSNDLLANGLEGVNLFNQYILLQEGKVYNVDTKEIADRLFENFEMIEPISLYSFIYDNHNIETYYTYSIIDKERVIEQQMLKKNSQIEMIFPTLNSKRNQIIMDSYNNKEYLTLLTEGKIVDLKEKIKKPAGFINKNIVEMSNNVYHNSNLVIIRYENGKIIVFNYRTGNIVYTTENENKVDILSYFIDNFSITNDNLFENSENVLYEESKEMAQILKENDLNEIITGENDLAIQREYITSYDPIKGKYVVYDVSSLVHNNNYGSNIVQLNNEQSINDVISLNNSLNLFYTNQIKIRVTAKKVYSLVIFLCIFLFIGLLICLLGKLLLKNKKDSIT